MIRTHKTFFRSILLGCFLIVGMIPAFAQRPMTGNSNDVLGISRDNPQNQINYGNIPGVIDNNAPPEQDTITKPPKIRKPLESYFFDDSMRVRNSFAWRLNMRENKVHEITIDTALVEFQVDFPVLQHQVGSAYLGALGAAGEPLDYFARPNYQDFSFAQAFDAYLITPERARFFNVKKPFTHFGYQSSGQKRKLEENFSIAHSQNISPSTGFNVDYKSRGTRGMYDRQGSRQKNLSLAFSHTGRQYSVHAGYIYNMTKLQENGGVLRDSDITDTIYEKPELLEVRLNDANNILKNNTFYVIQSYGIPLRRLYEEDFSIADRSSIFVGHSFQYSRYFKKYTDIKTGSGDFYENWYMNPTATQDSIFEGKISNRIFVQIQPWDRNGAIGTINAGIGNDILRYYQFHMQDYIRGAGSNVKRSATFVYGSLEGKIRKYVDWNAGIEYHPFGDRSQDMSIGGNLALRAFIRQRPITLSVSVRHERRSADYWSENYYSNHFMWQNSFSKENETRISATLDVPAFGIELGARYSMINNKIYVNANWVPAQYSGTVNVTGVYAKKDFRTGGFHFNNRVLLQWSTAQEIIPVPLASAFLSYFFEFNVVRNVLRMQIGIDGRYNTKYFAPGYNPATAQFYNQREKKLGGYIMLDAFVSAKWKRMRILLKLSHLNEDMFGERNYFNVLHYPQNMRMFKLGISWTFYD